MSVQFCLGHSLDMGRNSLKNNRDPTVGNEVATKSYIDRNNVRYDGATADINMQQHKLTNLPDPRCDHDCATKKYVDDCIFTDRMIGSYEQLSTNWRKSNNNWYSNQSTL
jgi:hypothetical protein